MHKIDRKLDRRLEGAITPGGIILHSESSVNE